MKKHTLKGLLVAATGMLLFSNSALATPVWNDNPYVDPSALAPAHDPGYLNPYLPTASGYYIWSNNSSRTSWSVRWTDNNNDVKTANETWSGYVEFLGNDNTWHQAVDWEGNPNNTNGGDGILIQGTDIFTWNEVISFPGATAGAKWDGFDFTIDENALAGSSIRFTLGGSLYNTLWVNPDFAGNPSEDPYILNGTQNGVEAQAMWIGGGYTPNVNVTYNPNTGYVYQRFETPAPVPEPATILLFGTGIAGLAGAARRKKAGKLKE